MAIAAVAAFAPTFAYSQAAATAPSAAAKPKPAPVPETDHTGDNEEVLTLTPFEVNAQRDTGYAATETLAGTRIRTNLSDVGASISVVTKEFLQDVGATDSGTLLQYTTNAEVAGTRGSYSGVGNGADETANLRSPQSAQRVRGLAAADNARDYYITDIPWDSFNVDRIDILRGPNSILYGLGSPAGIINGSTRNAEFRNLGNTEYRTGSYGTHRASIDVNQELIRSVLAIRLDAMWDDHKYEQQQSFQHDKRVYGTVRFDPQLFKNPSYHTSIKAKYEHGDISADRPRITPPNDSITPWFKPVAVSASNPFGGMGKAVVNNPYDPYRTDTANIVAGDGKGAIQSSTVNYLPWLGEFGGQQNTFWTIDGATNQTYNVEGGWINNGGKNSDGSFSGLSTGIPGRRQDGTFFGVNSLPGAANNLKLPGYQYGLYKTQSLLDSSVFDFYKHLIDGPTKKEGERWDAINFDISQSAFSDRIAVDVSYDRQKYRNVSQALLGYSPTLNIDIAKNFADFYTLGSDGITKVTNPNFGRPWVEGAANNGGSSKYTDREYKRLSLFGELRATDIVHGDLLQKIIGKHRLNGVYADEKYFNENRNWQMYANSQAWDGYWNNNDGNTHPFTDRPPEAFIYLGGPVNARDSASGAYIPGITSNVTLQDANVHAMDSTWTNYGVKYSDPWTVPSGAMSIAFNPATALTQSANPANYVGWNNNFHDQLVRYNDGADSTLLTLAQKSLRETFSYSGSYQGFMLNNALVTTLGWRFDEVRTKDVTAKNVPGARNALNLQPGVYDLPNYWPASQDIKGHSTSGGAMLHLNNLLPRDPLPFNLSGGYNESSNFQVTSIRRDLYGNPLGNPTGKTFEYTALLSTKDSKFSLRVTKYDTRVKNGSAGLNNAGGLGGVIQQGLRWRNVFLYQLGAYTWDTRNQPMYRNTWTNGYPDMAQDAAIAVENQAITGWNNIQKYLDSKGFFKAWNFTPLGPTSALVDFSTYQSDPTKYAPDPNTVSAYVATAPQGFTVTADTESKGYEYELTYNPLPNWRIMFNAAESTAVRNNVGGKTLDEFVTYMDSQIYASDGSLTPTGQLFQFGGAGSSIGAANWGPWRANYVQMKLSEGTRVAELRKWRYNVVSNYSFTHGWIKGFGIGAAYRWQDKVAIGYPIKGSAYDLSNPIYGPAENYADAWISYERKLNKKLSWRIQLNVYNIGKKDGLIPTSIEPDGKTWATVRVSPVQEWMMSNTLSF